MKLMGWLAMAFALLFGAATGFCAVDEGLTAITTDATSLFGTIKTLGLTILAFYIGYRLLREVKV